jgi:hypothetical protein
MDWFFDNRGDLTRRITCSISSGNGPRCLLSLLLPDQLRRVLEKMLDEDEFLSPHGIRSLSRRHADQPYVFEAGDYRTEVRYEPGESQTGLFGGNSNWRGPVWWPMNFLLINALRRYHQFYGDGFRVECPTGSGTQMTLEEVADELARRLVAIFRLHRDYRPWWGERTIHAGEAWRDLHLFHEYFHGETGEGLGASHQTGWTGLVANLLYRAEGEGTGR